MGQSNSKKISEVSTVRIYKSYFSLLPSDLIYSLFLFFNPQEFIQIMSKLMGRTDIIPQQVILKDIKLWDTIIPNTTSSFFISTTIPEYYSAIEEAIMTRNPLIVDKMLQLAVKRNISINPSKFHLFTRFAQGLKEKY